MPSDRQPSEIKQKAGSLGGKARAINLTPKQRAEIARKAAKARWAKRSQKAEGVAA